MKVYHSIDEFETLPNAVVTTGTFDGVHIGHQKIVQRLTEVARQTGGESVLLTFHPHPRTVLHPDLELKLITNMDEKAELLKKYGLDHLIIHPFTREFSRTTSLDFVRNLLVKKIGAKKLVIGYDHHFGRNREGSFEHLKEFGPVYGFDVEEIPAQDVDDIKVSSTKIRKALEEGNVEAASQYLGHAFFLTGFVVKGNRLGHTLGYPTANIELHDSNKLIPADGVYAVSVVRLEDDSTHHGMCNIGHRPTISGSEKTIEVNLFDFEDDLYGEKLRLAFGKRIRPEKRFENLDKLKEQLAKDETQCREYLSALSQPLF